MDYLQDLVSDNMGPEYIPTIPLVPKIDIPVYQDVRQPVTSPIPADPFADLKAVTQRPISEKQLGVQRFEGDIERFKQSKNYNTFGYNPNLQGIKTDDKWYDANEVRYQHAQTWGDVMKSSMGQFAGLAWNSFKNSAVSDGHFLNALFDFSGSDYLGDFKQRMIGSPEELLTADKEQKDIMNKNPIFQSPATEGVFNKEFMGDMIGQLGFTAGTGLYALGETFLGGALLRGIGVAARGKDFARLSRALEAAGTTPEAVTIAQNAQRTGDFAKAIEEITKMGDIAKDRNVMTSIWEGMKKVAVPFYESGTEMGAAYKAGATTSEVLGAGLPGLIKSYTMFNAARSEAGMEASSTYGQLYMGLLDQYEKDHGTPASGEDLQRIRTAAYGAATDNFIVNTGILMATNEIEFGGMMSKFSSSKRLLREAATAAETAEGKAMYTVEGKLADGATGTKVYQRGRFGAMGMFPSIRKDFGLGTALWEGAKMWGKGAAKFEVSEGIQEILQNTTDQTFRDYYTNLYNANKDLNGNILLDISKADWHKGLASQMNMEGWKTFLMGATTGLFLSPLSAMGMYGRHKGQMAISQQYKDTYNAQQQILKDNVSILNQFYSDPKNALRDHVSANKTATHAIKSMKDTLPADDRYTFYNNQDDILTKAAAVAIKTGTIGPFLNTMKSIGDGRLSEQEMREDMNIPDTGEDTNPHKMLADIIEGITAYHTSYQNLMDKFSGLVIPEIHADPAKYQLALIQKKALLDAIEVIATFGYNGVQVAKRAAQIKNKLSELPSISSASNRAFDLLSNEPALKEEIRQKREQLKLAQEMTDVDSKEMAKSLQNQLHALETWNSSYTIFQATKKIPMKEESDEHLIRKTHLDILRVMFKKYIESYNHHANIHTVLDDNDIEKAFDNLGDYIALNRDYGHYVQALNILTDPHNFTSLHGKIVEGMTASTVDNKMKAEEEVVNRTEATAPAENSTAPITDTSDTEQPPVVRELRTYDLQKIGKDIIDYYSVIHDEGDESSAEVDNFLEDHPDVKKAINRAYKKVEERSNIEGGISVKVKEELGKDIRKIVADKIAELTPAPVEEKVPEPVKIYPKLPFNVIVGSDKMYVPADMKESSDKALRSIPTEQMGILTADNITMVINRNLYGIREKAGQQEVYQTVTGRAISTHPDIQSAQDALSKKQSPYSYQDNPSISINREVYEVGIYSGGTLLGFIPAANKYLFTINGKEAAIPSSPDDFAKVVDIGDMSKEDAYSKWSNDYNKNQVLATAIDKIMAGKDKALLAGEDVDKLVKVYRKMSSYDFMNSPEQRATRPTLQDMVDTGSKLLAVTTKDGAIAIDNTDGTNISEPDNLLSDYRALIDKDGQQHWIELSPPVINDEYLSILSSQLHDMLKTANTLEYGDEQRKAIVKDMNDSLDTFITTRPGSIINIMDLKIGDFNDGVKVWLKVKPKGAPAGKFFSANIVTKGKIDTSFLIAEDKKTALVHAINATDTKFQEWAKKNGVDLKGEHIAIGPNNLRYQTSKNPGVVDIMGMQSSVGTSVAKSYSLGYTTVDSTIPNTIVPVVPTVVTEQAPVEGNGIAQETDIQLSIINIHPLKININKGINPRSVISTERMGETSGNAGKAFYISIDIAEEAYRKYYEHQGGNKGHHVQPYDTLVRRGGFSMGELDMYVPNWREDLFKAETADISLSTLQTGIMPTKIAEKVIIDEVIAEGNDDPVEEIKALRKRKKKSDTAKKVVYSTQPFTDSSVVNIDVFRQWVKDKLPADMVVEDLGNLTGNLLSQNVTVGQFITSLKTIQIHRDAPFKYHEAFHGVFRLLLPQDRIDLLLGIAKKEIGYSIGSKYLQGELDKFRSLHVLYKDMSNEDLYDLYAEEYIADKFDGWMDNRNIRTSSMLKGFFAKILDWIKEFFNRFAGNDIQALFHEIDRGRYRNAHLQNNQFTEGVSQSAMKVVQIGTQDITDEHGNVTTIPRYLPQQKGEQLACTVAALYHQMIQTEPQQSKNSLLDKILNMYKDMLDPDSPKYIERAKKITDKKTRVEWLNSLIDLHEVFDTKSSRDAIKEAVDEHLQLMGYRQELDENAYEAAENRDGVQTTANYNKEADMFGGYNALSKVLREYVGSTTASYTDEFGNTHFEDDTPLVEAVPASYVYNGMMKVLSNSADDNVLIDKMLVYLESGNNFATKAFIQRVFDETGFDRDATGIWIVSKNPLLLQSVIKGFNNYDTNPLFIEIAPNGGIKGYNVNRQDSAKVQFDEWAQAFDRQFMTLYDQKRGKEQILKKPRSILKGLQSKMSEAQKDTGIKDGTLADFSLDISNRLKLSLGINLSPTYIAYSIVRSKSEDVTTDYQKRLLNANRDVYPVSFDDIDGILSSLDKDGNIFIAKEGTDLTGATTRLMKIAAGNAYFDETVDSMTYKGPDGEIHYSSQAPNYQMIRTQEFNKESVLDTLHDSEDHNNFLLDEDSEFRKMADLGIIKTQHISGMRIREGAISSDEQGDNQDVGADTGKGEGAAYKDFNEREVNTFLLSSYGIQNSKVTYGAGKNDYFYTSPHLITVIEAKSTGHLSRLPVNIAIQTKGDKVTLTASTLDKLFQWVQQDFDRIKKVQQDIDNGENFKEGYDKGANRGLRLYNTKLWFTDEYRDSIEQGALTDGYTLNEKEVKEQLQQHFQQDIQDYIDYIADQGIISRSLEGIKNNLLPNFIVNGFADEDRSSAMNLQRGNMLHNIAQIYMNDMLNTTAIRQLLYGNEAAAYKDNIDRIKRMAGGVASGRSAAFSYSAPELGIEHSFTTFHHVTYKSNTFTKMNGEKKGDKDDAQMYTTEKGMRYLLFGIGKLTKVQADILTKMKEGIPVSEKEFFGAGGLKEQGAFNSQKVVYFDNNNVYLKCSLFPLFKEYTSVLVDGEWQALPYMQDLHHLREQLERYEDDHSTVVYAGPDTHSKGLKEHVADNIYSIRDEHYRPLESKWLRLQMENPSNKTSITDPTQAKQQIMSEQDSSMTPVINQYMEHTADRISNSYSTAANQIFSLDDGIVELNKSIDANTVTPELGKFFKIMRETLEATGADQQTLDFLEVQDGQPVYDLNFPATLQKFTQIYMSYFSKAMSEKTPGLTLALVSDFGTQRMKEVIEVGDDGQPKRWGVVTDKEYKKNPARYSVYRRWSDTENRLFSGLEKGDYIIDDLRHNVPEYDEQGNITGRFSEYIRPAHWGEEMNGIVQALQYGFGVRIPSDDKHSYITLKMVDSMSIALGSVGVFPQELLEVSGADFDIDKLFIQLQDTYMSGDKRVAYGNTSDPKEQFEEYIIWQAKNNKAVKDMIGKISDTDEGFIAAVLGDDRQILIAALKELKMPSNVGEFIDSGGERLNNGVLNNRILASKIALLNNEHIAGQGKDSILNQGTSTDILTDLAKELVEAGILPDEEEVDINTLRGKGISYINNKEGQRNIGAAINAMLAFSVLEQFHVPILGDKVMYDGHTFDTFSGALTTDGKRKFAQISAIVNAMTDNAKERLAAKLGLNITAVGYVTTMVAQGIPLKDSVLYMLQPSVREYFKRLSRLDGIVKTEREKKTSKKNLLDNMIGVLEKDIAPDAELPTITLDKLSQSITDRGADKLFQLAVLKDIATIKKQSDTLRTLSSIMKLNQGMDVTWEDVDSTKEQLKELGIVDGHATELPEGSPIDVRDILTHRHPIFATYIKILNQVSELGKKVFIERTSLFKDITDTVEVNMNVSNTETGRLWRKTLKEDLISYLSIRSYIHWLKERGSNIDSLDHAMIYDSAKDNKDPEYKNIVDVIKDIREKTDNYLVNKFLRYVQAGEESNKDNINKAEGNTWAKLSEHQQQKLYDSFVSLYNDADTRKDAIALFNYLLVKDGGQFRSGSFVKYIPVFAFKDMLDRTKGINKMLSSGNEDYMSIFGYSKEQVLSEFMTSYGTHTANRTYLKNVEPSAVWSSSKEDLEGLSPADAAVISAFRATPVSVLGNTMTIGLFTGIRSDDKKKTKFSKVENKMLEKNTKAIYDSGFSTFTIEEKKKKVSRIQFPYTVNRQISNEDTGSIYTQLFVLKSVDGKEPVLIEGHKMPIGVKAIYEKEQYRGSRRQWKGAGVFGQVPLATVSARKGSVDSTGYSPSSPGTNVVEKESVDLTKLSPINRDTPVMKALQENFGISVEYDSRGNKRLMKDNRWYNVAPGTTPKMLLDQLTGNTMPSQQDVVSSRPMDFSQHEGFSGAADGSDKFWAEEGKKRGIGKWTDYLTTHLDKLTPIQRSEVENAYIKAANDLGRPPISASTYAGKLVRRDYLQVKAVNTVYAIGNIVSPGDINKKGYKVKSKTDSVDRGTGYAVQMAINLGKEVHVFDQGKEQWYKWNKGIGRFIAENTPSLSRKFAGIGTRELTDTGRQTIRDVFDNTTASTEPVVPLQDMTSEQWKQSLSDIYDEKFSKVVSKNHPMSYKMEPTENILNRKTSTLELAEEGLRTATTRSYPLGKIGDIITFEGRPQQYRITDIEQLTKELVSDSQWVKKWAEKEQWTSSHFNKVLGGSTVHIGSWQTSFEKMLTKDRNTWLREALNFRNSIRGTIADTDILQKIKDCL